MTTLDRQRDVDAGSRMHVLDWLESPDFLSQLRRLVEPTGLAIADDAERRPKGRQDHRESVLVGRKAPFLSTDQQDILAGWWLFYTSGRKPDLTGGLRPRRLEPRCGSGGSEAHATELKLASRPLRETH
jgi:hypothetical protein